MTNAPSTFLVDTNVLIYAVDLAEAAKQRQALRVLEALTYSDRGILSAQILGEFFNAATRPRRQLLTSAEAESSVVTYARAWRILPITQSIVVEAVRGNRQHLISYYDAVVWATAKLNGVPTILSEDLQDGQLIEGVRFINPFTPSFDLALLS